MDECTIVIVDSEPVDAAELEAALSAGDCRCEICGDAGSTLERLGDTSKPVSAVLLDWEIDSSLEILRRLKALEGQPEIEVVVHASEFDAGQVSTGIENGAYYYLTRPFEESQLVAIMRAAAAINRLRRRLDERVQGAEDALRMLDFGRFRFRSIPSGDLLAVHIASACGRPDAALGLRELMVNAVEHGNLGISYADKSVLIAEGRLADERARRLALPENADKYTEVTLQRLPDAIEITIRDTGPGFDYARYMEMDEERMFDAHGRGVLMASATLELEYLPPGNQVRVRVPIETAR